MLAMPAATGGRGELGSSPELEDGASSGPEGGAGALAGAGAGVGTAAPGAGSGAIGGSGRDRPVGIAVPGTVLGGFSVVFVIRTVVHHGGHRYLSLFDDGMISMRYAHNLASGRGLVWNPGQRPVEGYTNLGWTLWMALLHLIGLPGPGVVLAVIASAVALAVAGLALVRSVALELSPNDRYPAQAAVWLTALAYPLAFWALRGMEVSLLAACTSALALFALRVRLRPTDQRNLGCLATTIAVAIVVRTDAVIVCTVAALAAGWWAPPGRLRRRTLIVVVGTLVGVLAAQTAFRLAYYGDPLPNTYYLKVAGTTLSERLGRGTDSAVALATAGLLPLILLGVGAVVRALRQPAPVRPEEHQTRAAALLLAILVLFPAAYSVYVGGDAWEWMQFANRYQATSLPMLCVLAGAGMVAVLDAAPRARRAALTGGTALMGVSLLAAARGLVPTAGLQYSLPGTQDLADRATFTLAAVVVCLVLALRRLPPAGWARGSRSLAAGIVAVLLVLDGPALAAWARTTGPHVSDDGTMALYGLVVRDVTAPSATTAVVWAGASTYYSGRPSIDLLGKSDRHIAHEAPRKVPFYPGHTKWDYAWSIGRLRPDLVADLARDTPAVDSQLRSWGYDELAPRVWARHDSDLVDRRGLIDELTANPRIEALLQGHG